MQITAGRTAPQVREPGIPIVTVRIRLSRRSRLASIDTGLGGYESIKLPTEDDVAILAARQP
ncbi:hypothetical protein [Streptomyces luteogriseus]|uniref:hypothetical protein n=1 Tax=Streptomyces luteogriseus TaxID=68233 RepID=UPI00380FF632